ncbi:hypothetical protein L3X38_004793 [Prunus dulcis]|uniref:Uncharacterized protein n=1 Tax=Prunus dulcis TaxID=3755 RepID=A0AAD5F3H6_PRUDU|nr:hypothetical protein L3X38_004793 [Prunus dulcis]
MQWFETQFSNPSWTSFSEALLAHFGYGKWLAPASDNCWKLTRTQSHPFPIRFSLGSGFHLPCLPPNSAPSYVVSGHRPRRLHMLSPANDPFPCSLKQRFKTALKKISASTVMR